MRGRRRSFPRKRHVVLAAMLGVAMAGLPGIASSETPGIAAYDEPGGYGYHSWTPTTATIQAGGAVKFSNPYSEVSHGLKFTGGPATPSCTGIPAAAGEVSGATNWHGECTFAAAGTYTFICTVHPTEMKGTITVTAAGTPVPGPTPTPTPTPTPVPQPKSGEPAPEGPFVGAAAQALKLAKNQRGGVVKGSIDVSRTGSGGRLEVDVFAASATIARTSGARGGRTRVGRLIRSSVATGIVPFSVKLDAKARRALERRHLLGLTVRVTLTPHDGKALTITRTIVEHG